MSKLRYLIFNLPWYYTEKDVARYFSKFGTVVDSSLEMNWKKGMSRSRCFIKFEKVDNEMEMLKTHVIEGQEVHVKALNH